MDEQAPPGGQTGAVAELGHGVRVVSEADVAGTSDVAATDRSDGFFQVLRDVPAAVLLADLGRHEIVHANPAAALMAPGLSLPAPAHVWTQAAGLSLPTGATQAAGSDPVSRAVAGRAVFGEPVTVSRQGVDRPMWVTGFPVPGEPRRDHDRNRDAVLALIVLLDVQTDLTESQIRDRAVVAAGLSVTISDPRQDDAPLIYVNPAFERTTGYSAADVLGTNCRFLQGPDTDPAMIQQVRDALAAQEHAVITLLNYRKDGTSFWNELSLSPVYDGSDTLTHYVGLQMDVSSRVAIDQERARHLAAEQAARASAEAAQRRLALLAEATSLLAATLDVDESLQRLTRLVVPALADWCMIHLRRDGDRPARTVAVHRDPDRHELLARIQTDNLDSLRGSAAARSVLAGGPPTLLRTVTNQTLNDVIVDPAVAAAYQELGCNSAIFVPLRARREVFGVLTLICDGSGRLFDENDLAMASDLARRAALTMDNARLYSREHDVAEALQRSLLPALPQVDGLDVAARYLPGSTAAQVGGDWYDVFRLPPRDLDGTERRSSVRVEVGVAIGDVMGHDLTAAAAMGQLRSVLRSYAWQGDRPALVLDHLDQLVQGLDMAQLATALYARLSLPAGEQPGALIFSNAGHLPPVLRSPDGSARLLEGAQSVLVGAALGIARDDASVPVSPGTMLVLYTDGLVEQRGLDPDVGLERLRAAVEALPGDLPAELTCDALLLAMDGHERDDDVALLVVRLL